MQYPVELYGCLLAPLADSSSEPEKKATYYYDFNRQPPNVEIPPNLNTKQFEHMIAELTPFEETAVGKELINKGREAGLETALITVAKAKFEQLTEQHQKAIKALNEAQLNKLAALLVNFASLVELESWLNNKHVI